MKVLVHPDPIVLEQVLLDRVAASRRDDPLGRLLVLVPTVRLAQHVQRRLAERLDACLGVDVLHHGALVLRILDERPGGSPRPASPRLLAALLERVLGGLGEHPWAVFTRERPGAVPALLGALNDLREAGITPDEVRRALDDRPEGAVTRVYEAYVAALGKRGLTDRAGFVEAALPGAASHAARFREVLHHGAYELIGVHLDLVRALDRSAPVTFLAPAEPGARAFAYFERFARDHLLDRGEELDRLPDSPGALLGGRLRFLYDESARPDPIEPGRVHLRHAQGARDEIGAAVHAALDAVERGTSGVEIALVARSLEPYATALEDVLDGAGSSPGENAEARPAIPWTSSLGAPLRREPEVRDLLLLLRVVAGDFPRAATAELLRSPHVRWRAVGVAGRPPVDRVEAWSRKAGIVSGLDEWRRTLPRRAASAPSTGDAGASERAAAAEQARGQAERIVDALEALARRVRTAAGRWTAHADALEALVREVLPGIGDAPPAAPLSTLLGLFDEMRDLDRQVGDARRVPFAEMVEWLERAVEATPLLARGEDRGGLRVLDAMQARGLTFDRVVWVGFQSGVFPRAPREDPFLPDDSRRKLREATGRALPVKAEGEDEERLLLALLLGSAREHVEISWQRSDESGRPRNPSVALREVARVMIGRPDAAELAREPASRIRSHPRDSLEDLAATAGLLSPSEDLLWLALRSAGDPRAEDALLARQPALAPGLRMMRATESLSPRDLIYDARIGAELAGAPADLSVTAFQQLGSCPLQYFFQRRLGVHALDEEADPFQLAAREMGSRVHRILETVYRTLQEEGRFGAGGAGALEERAQALLAVAWGSEMDDLGEQLGRRVPLLWSVEEARWRAAIEAFVREDLARIARTGRVPRSFEELIEEPLLLAPGIDLRLRGRFDRVLASEDGLVVGDYKTSGNLKRRVSASSMLRGQMLQVPLYRLLAGGGARVELLGVGPEYHGDGRRSADGERHVEFEGFGDEDAERGFRETLRVLLRYLEAGCFPMVRDDRHCGWCEYRRACRRSHPPTVHREEVAPDAAELRGVGAKTTKNGRVLLERVRGGAR